MSYRAFLRPAAALLCASMMALSTAAISKEVVKVGFIGPLTGGNSAIGIGGRNSAELAVKEMNENPQAKYTYEFVSYDDECKPNVGIQVATKLATDRKVATGITHFCSAVALGAVDVYHRFHLPVIIWGAVDPAITYAKDYKEIFRSTGTLINQNQQAANFMTKKLGYKTFAILHDTTDYGKSHMEYFSKFVKENGGTVVGTFGVTPDQQDFTAELTKAKALKPDVIYLGALVPIATRVRSQMVKLGIDSQFEGCSGIKSDAFIAGTGAEAAEGTIAFIEGAPIEKLPGGKQFVKSYNDHGFTESYEAYGPFAYTAMKQVVEAVEAVGPDRRKIAAKLAETKHADSLIGKITYDDHRQNIEPSVSCYVVQDGKWVFWDDSDYASGKRSLKKPQ